jgi:hypothetical protein
MSEIDLVKYGVLWQKVEGYVKIRPLNNLFRTDSEE